MTTIIDVGNELQLNQAIATVDAATSGSYVIQFTANIAEGTDTGAAITYNGKMLSAPPDLYALNLNSNVQLTIDGSNGSAGNFTLDGNNTYRGFLAYSGAVTIENLNIDETTAQGGAGGAGFLAGGGAGLGGGVFVNAGATVTLSGVGFSKDRATGGNGGSRYVYNNSTGFGGGGGGSGIYGTLGHLVPRER